MALAPLLFFHLVERKLHRNGRIAKYPCLIGEHTVEHMGLALPEGQAADPAKKACETPKERPAPATPPKGKPELHTAGRK